MDTGEGAPIVYTPPKRVEPIGIDAGAFQEVMTRFVLDMRFSLRPEQEERPRVRFASWAPEPRTQGRDYGAWCSRQDSPGECLSLLEDGFTFLDAKVRRKMALSFAWDGVWEEAQEAVKESINPLALKAMITSAMAAYMILVVAPEPVTKLVAIALTTYVIAYIGLDLFANLVEGWQQLTMDSEKAVSFHELEEAGHRFGKVMGANGARVLILALTAALGGGAANMASKGPMLPGFARVALAAETNAGFQLSAAMAGGVRSISVAEGVMTVGLAPHAVAMAARGQGRQGEPQRGNSTQATLYENQLPEQLAAELETAQRLGVRPVSVDSPEFLRYASGERIKWVVTEEGQLRIIPHRWQEVEISHAVASGGRPVLAAGEAELSIHGSTRFGIRITPRSGHYLNGASQSTSDRVLEFGRRAFAQFGITFVP
uniref:SitA5 family polymorphic toxin n=1 Tax=Stigmatella hybrida TaxID=394097 RepID=UPI001CDB22A2|nr:hypothetical protein [Stigmatella hybrida]